VLATGTVLTHCCLFCGGRHGFTWRRPPAGCRSRATPAPWLFGRDLGAPGERGFFTTNRKRYRPLVRVPALIDWVTPGAVVSRGGGVGGGGGSEVGGR